MAQVTGATLSSSVVEIINSEYISNLIIEAQRAPAFAEMIADVRDASGVNSATYAFPKWDATAVAYSFSSGKDETDEIAAVEQTLTEVTCTAATIGTRTGIGDETQMDSLQDLVAHAVMEHNAALRQQAATDLLSLFTSGTDTSGNFTSLALTLDRLGVAFAAYRAKNPGAGRHVFVGHNSQLRDLRASLRTANGGIFGTEHGSSAAASMLDMSRLGFIGMYEGVEIWETGLVPAASTDYVGAVFKAGTGGALGMPVWWNVTTEAEREAKRGMDDIVSTMRYAVALVNQGSLVKVTSAA